MCWLTFRALALRQSARNISQHTIYDVQHIHISLTLIHCTKKCAQLLLTLKVGQLTWNECAQACHLPAWKQMAHITHYYIVCKNAVRN